jgi:hypothetical protein
LKKIFAALIVLALSSSAFADNKDNYNFRFSPIGLLVGAITVNYDIAISDSWTLGPELEYWHFSLSEDSDFLSDYSVTAYAVGARANWFMNGKYTDGLYVGPRIDYVNIKLTTTDFTGDVTGTASTIVAGCLVGYGWFWNSFNQMLGIGASVGLGSTSVNITDSSGTSSSVSTSVAGLIGEYSLGWTF